MGHTRDVPFHRQTRQPAHDRHETLEETEEQAYSQGMGDPQVPYGETA
jgi:hypothetical protein